MYTYDIDAAAMFDDRTDQFAKFGVPLEDIERVRSAVDDMWADAPGGWVYEWSRVARDYAERGDHRMASLVYGCEVHRHLDRSATVPDGDDAALEVHRKAVGRQLKLLELVLQRLDPGGVRQAGELGCIRPTADTRTARY